MPASIILSSLGWSAPDGTPVLSDLDLTFGPERTGIVGRNGSGKTSLLRLIARELAPTKGRVAVHGTVAKLRQIVGVQEGETIADLFGVAGALAVLDRAERGLAGPDDLADADWMLPARIEAALAKVGLDMVVGTPLGALSGGQRTRAALAAAIFAGPDFLLLDEPTNHLDRAGRQAVLDVLADWRGGAVVVSHDRELLEQMDAIVELTSFGASRYGGNWSAYRARKAMELEAASHDLAVAERQSAETARNAQAMTERKQRRDAAGERKGARGDMPRILVGARRNRAEGSGGDAKRLMERQKREAAELLATARHKVETLESMNVLLPPTGLPTERVVLRLDRVTAGYEPGAPVLVDVSLVLTGPERVAIVGPNGAGKSTLLAVANGALMPWSGAAHCFVKRAMLDQDVGILDPETSVAENFARLNPAADQNACRAALARFRFRGDDALRIVGNLSGGEALRAGLACVLGSGDPPQLLILDEPTNHLDLDSLGAVEDGLNGYDGALLVVSHDEAFLASIGIGRRVALE
jgi:ATPase subunit of ABC transporter with duplicated ATPase domains